MCQGWGILDNSSDTKTKKALNVAIRRFLNFGGTCGGRTHDKRIKSPLLYQLS